MRVCNNFKPLPRGWDQPEKTHAMSHVTSPSHRLIRYVLNSYLLFTLNSAG